MIFQAKYALCAALLLGAGSQMRIAAQASAPVSTGNKPIQIFVTVSGKNTIMLDEISQKWDK